MHARNERIGALHDLTINVKHHGLSRADRDRLHAACGHTLTPIQPSEEQRRNPPEIAGDPTILHDHQVEPAVFQARGRRNPHAKPVLCRIRQGDDERLRLKRLSIGRHGVLDRPVPQEIASGRGQIRQEPAVTDAHGHACRHARIEADPDAFTVQGHLPPSRAPLPLADGSLAARPAMLRVYAIADPFERWHVLPGGLTRVATRAPLSVSMQQGGTSLDTWVVADGPVDTFSMLPQHLTVDDLAARRAPVASRTGENLFWLGRYTERTEQAVRLARAALNLIDGDDEVLAPLLAALSRLAAFVGLVGAGTPGAERSPAVFERSLLAALAGDGSGAVGRNLDAMARCAGALRDRLSSEHWGLVRRMGDDLPQHFERQGARVPDTSQALPALQRLATQLAAVTGMQTDRMTRDHGWRLLSVGRLLERLSGMAAAMGELLAAVDPRGGSAQATALLLELFDSSITFRARYQRHEDLLALADLLVIDDTNPRAFAGTLRRLRTEIAKLPGPPAWRDEMRDLMPAQGAGLALDDLRGSSPVEVSARVAALARLLAERAATLSDRIGQRYFTHAAAEAMRSL